jgi:hypothetical protein
MRKNWRNRRKKFCFQVVQTIEDGLRQIVMASRVLANHLLNANLTNIDTLSSDIGT